MKKWEIIWTVWLLAVLLTVAASFAVLEYESWNTLTLSRYVWNLSVHWPLFIFLVGHFVGSLTTGLAVHFWWHWSPPGSISEG